MEVLNWFIFSVNQVLHLESLAESNICHWMEQKEEVQLVDMVSKFFFFWPPSPHEQISRDLLGSAKGVAPWREDGSVSEQPFNLATPGPNLFFVRLAWLI